MLTPDDLEQIGKVIDARLDAKLDEKLAPLKTDIKTVTEDMQRVKKDLRGVKKTVDVMARLLDGEQMRQRKRIDRIEDHLGMPRPE